MVEFYKRDGSVPGREKVVQWTETYTLQCAEKLGIQQHFPLLMCNFHRESEFQIDLKGLPPEDSFGVGQVRTSYERGLRSFWSKKGVNLGPSSNLQTQVYFSVAMFKFKLDGQKGNAFEAIRAYNGSGPGARNHRRKVRASLRVIYGIDLRPNGKYVPWRKK